MTTRNDARNSSLSRRFGGPKLALSAVVLMVAALLPFSEAVADQERRIQLATGQGIAADGVSAEVDDQPYQGHALVVMSSVYSPLDDNQRENLSAEIVDDDSWTKTFEEVEGHRGLAVWVKTAAGGEPTEVTVEWDEEYLDDPSSDPSLVNFHEFEGAYSPDVQAHNSTGYGDHCPYLWTDETDETRIGADSSIVVGGYVVLPDDGEEVDFEGDEQGWFDTAVDEEDGDECGVVEEDFDTAPRNLEHETQQFWDSEDAGLLTGYLYSTDTGTAWESTGHVGEEDSSYTVAGLTVFSETDLNFDDDCTPEETTVTDEDYDDEDCVLDAPVEGWEDGAKNPDSIRVFADSELDPEEEIPYVGESFEIMQRESDACDDDEVCHLGWCRENTDFRGCSDDDHCDDDHVFCHPYLGCVDDTNRDDDEDGPCTSDDQCDSNDFCWRGKCWDGGDCSDDPENCDDDEACADDRACVEVDGQVSGDDDGYCPYDEAQAGNWDCEDDGATSDSFCHEIAGCINDDYLGEDGEPCEEDDDCDTDEDEICWEGACVEDDDDDVCEMFEGGWDFVDGEEGEEVHLTEDYCERALGVEIDEVTVVRACACDDVFEEHGVDEGDGCTNFHPDAEANEAAPCVNDDSGTLSCRDGRLVCDQDDDYYEPGEIGDDECDIVCNEVFEDEDATCSPGCDGEYFWTPDGETFCDGELDSMLEEDDSRCGASVITGEEEQEVGEFNCPEGPDDTDPEDNCQVVDELAPNLRPMPELCDGLNSSCSGTPDDITRSWVNFLRQDDVWDHEDEDNHYWTEDDHEQFLDLREEWEQDLGIDLSDPDNMEDEELLEVPERLGDWEALDDEDPDGAACYGEDICTSHSCDNGHTDPYEELEDLTMTVKEELLYYIEDYNSTQGCQCMAD